MKFKIGDRVKNIGRESYYGICLGDIGTVTEESKAPFVRWNKNEKLVAFNEEDLELVCTYEDLKKSPIGTKVIFENNTLIKTGENNYESNDYYRDNADLKDLKDNCGSCFLGKIIKIEEPIYQTVYEAKVEILDETEKRYLEGIIRPFKNKIKTIRKTDNKMNGKDNQYITIAFKEDFNMDFPNFKPNTMYKGMKLYKEYTLEELGL